MDCKLKTATAERARTLHRPPFDFAAVKRIHAYLDLERARERERERDLIKGRSCGLENEKHESSRYLARGELAAEKALQARARARGRARRSYANLCELSKLQFPPPGDDPDYWVIGYTSVLLLLLLLLLFFSSER